jgi:hypothetical protein
MTHSTTGQNTATRGMRRAACKTLVVPCNTQHAAYNMRQPCNDGDGGAAGAQPQPRSGQGRDDQSLDPRGEAMPCLCSIEYSRSTAETPACCFQLPASDSTRTVCPHLRATFVMGVHE